jgi:hypothetical protein
MAILNLGRFTDINPHGTTTCVEVPDEKVLPPLPESIAKLQPIGVGYFGDRYGLEAHLWVNVTVTWNGCSGISLLCMYVANRTEWVCLICDSYLCPYGYDYGEHSVSGPYRVSPELMCCVLQTYGVPLDFIPSEEFRSVHPDRLVEFSRLDDATISQPPVP